MGDCYLSASMKSNKDMELKRYREFANCTPKTAKSIKKNKINIEQSTAKKPKFLYTHK